MIDYYEKENFDRAVYTIVNDIIIKHRLLDLCEEYADETTTPRGVLPRFHTRGAELWSWGIDGDNPYLVETFETEAEAEHALRLSFKFDLYNFDDSPEVYDSYDEAEKALAKLRQERVYTVLLTTGTIGILDEQTAEPEKLIGRQVKITSISENGAPQTIFGTLDSILEHGEY